MGFLQKNVNAFLLLLLLAMVGALAGASVYYQSTFDKLTSKYDNTSMNLSQCTADLHNYQFNLNKTLSTLNTTSQDIRRYDELYAEKATQLSSTQEDLNETSSELQKTRIDLAEEQALKRKYQQEYQEEVAVNKGLVEQNAILTSQKTQLEATIISYRSKLDAANGCIADFLDDYDAGLTSAMKDELDSCQR